MLSLVPRADSKWFDDPFHSRLFLPRKRMREQGIMWSGLVSILFLVEGGYSDILNVNRYEQTIVLFYWVDLKSLSTTESIAKPFFPCN